MLLLRFNSIRNDNNYVDIDNGYNGFLEGRRYLQLTLSVTVVSYFSPSFMARLNTTHRNRAPSSSFVGVMVSVLVVWWSFEAPRFTIACKGVGLPSRYHLDKLNVTNFNSCVRVSHENWSVTRLIQFGFYSGVVIEKKVTYVIVGSGDPPTLLHVNSCFFSSVATTILPGATSGGWGGVRTVKL